MTGKSFSIFGCPRENSVVWVLLLLFAMLSSLLVISNPGFFSHDELQKVDHIIRFGFSDYMRNYVRFYQGVEFGQPVRPFSFLVQGLVSLALPNYPVVVHLVDVLTHGVVAVLFFYAISEFRQGRQFAWVATLLFICSPLVTFAVGWPAALMDRFYVLFGLIAFIASARYVTLRGGPIYLFLILVSSALAMLSKETAIVLPCVLCVFLIFPSVFKIDRYRLLGVFIAWSLPIGAFLGYRLVALVGSFGAQSSSPYAASFSNLAEGLFVYGVYPFLPKLSEAGIWRGLASGDLVGSVILHALLVAMLWRSFSLKIAIFYVFAYYLFLAPVLLIPIKGAHYLYGSGMVLSSALAALLTLSPRRSMLRIQIPAYALIAVVLAHGFMNQLFIYRIGVCMNSAMISMEGTYLAAHRPSTMRIRIAENAPGHILYRLTTGREQIGSFYPVHFEILDGKNEIDGKAMYEFSRNCIVHGK